MVTIPAMGVPKEEENEEKDLPVCYGKNIPPEKNGNRKGNEVSPGRHGAGINDGHGMVRGNGRTGGPGRKGEPKKSRLLPQAALVLPYCPFLITRRPGASSRAGPWGTRQCS